ncbi:hypothetical protein J1N35_021915 [Gossypium stocksii]|uniref:Uncharacterized protein n=1 Tax=Gossypium stocksii TaxID=47602 RepID=A0A9D3VGQ8_9ROSI|nr:hypothetical protein J1N35_021915 [Gossypium stocksii]
MKERISAKIIQIIKLTISTNPIKFTEIKLVDDENMETVVNDHTKLIWLFAELANTKPFKDFTPLGEEYRVQDPCTEVTGGSVDRRSTVYKFYINLNAPPAYIKP